MLNIRAGVCYAGGGEGLASNCAESNRLKFAPEEPHVGLGMLTVRGGRFDSFVVAANKAEESYCQTKVQLYALYPFCACLYDGI